MIGPTPRFSTRVFALAALVAFAAANINHAAEQTPPTVITPKSKTKSAPAAVTSPAVLEPAPLAPGDTPATQKDVERILKAIADQDSRLDGRLAGLEERLRAVEGRPAGSAGGGPARALLGQGLVVRPEGAAAMPLTAAAAMARGDQFVVGDTGELKGTGLQPRTDVERANALRQFAMFSIGYQETPVVAEPLPKAYDVRRLLPATAALHVHNQHSCGSCWAFAAVAAFEANHALKSGRAADASEQYVMNCVTLKRTGFPGCQGGYIDSGIEVLANRGTIARSASGGAYLNKDGQSCDTSVTRTFQATAFGPISRSAAPPADDELKKVIRKYGAVVVGMKAHQAFARFGDANHTDTAIWDREETLAVNHAVCLIGWDDDKGAWLVKNSWGTQWGHTGGFGSERGYMWVKYKTNGVGTEATWIEAKVAEKGPDPALPPTIPTSPYAEKVKAVMAFWEANFPQFVPR